VRTILVGGSRPSKKIRDDCYDEQNDRDPENETRAFHCGSRNSAETERGCNNGDDQKYDRIVQ